MARQTMILILVIVALAVLNLAQFMASGSDSSRAALTSSPPADDAVIKRFYEIWHDRTQPTIWANEWLGVPTVQNHR